MLLSTRFFIDSQKRAGAINKIIIDRLPFLFLQCHLDKNASGQIERIPEFYAHANIAYRNTTGQYGADLMTRYIGDLYERGLAPYQDINYGNFFVADISGFVRFGSRQQHKISLRMENVFDKDYATQYNRATDPDRAFFVYHQYGLPRNIILGYTYTF